MKTALVTGGSRGIGRAICLALAKELGYHILINFLENNKAAEETLQLIQADGGSAELLAFDVGNAEKSKYVLDSWQKQNGDHQIEVVVNNAGIKRDGLFIWTKPEDWQAVINTNLNGFYNTTQPVLQAMLLKRYGRIINVVSLSGLKGTAGQVNYAAAKGAVVAATKSLSLEVAKRKITVNAVAPGFIETDMTADLDQNDLKERIPAHRFGTAEEVADLVCFLASRKASYITGEVININGGIYS